MLYTANKFKVLIAFLFLEYKFDVMYCLISFSKVRKNVF